MQYLTSYDIIIWFILITYVFFKCHHYCYIKLWKIINYFWIDNENQQIWLVFHLYILKENITLVMCVNWLLLAQLFWYHMFCEKYYGSLAKLKRIPMGFIYFAKGTECSWFHELTKILIYYWYLLLMLSIKCQFYLTWLGFFSGYFELNQT